MKNHFGSTAGCYIILLKTTSGDDNMRTIQKILETMFQLNIVNVIVLVRGKSSVHLDVYSYTAFQKNQCGKVTPTIVNRFDNGAFSNPDLFPNQLKNFHNCSLRFLVRTVEPFVTYRQEKKGTEIVGIEAELLKLIAKDLNFHMEFEDDPLYFWGDVCKNGASTGPFQLLEAKAVDISLTHRCRLSIAAQAWHICKQVL